MQSLWSTGLETKRKIKAFGTPDCEICKKIDPILTELIKRPDVFIVLYDRNLKVHEELFKKENITTIPIIKFYEDDVVYDEIVGLTTIEEILEKYTKEIIREE
jgi:thiol-disulfide isomerase/thioredoxin